MPPIPNEYVPDNTDGRALTEYAAELLRDINEDQYKGKENPKHQKG